MLYSDEAEPGTEYTRVQAQLAPFLTHSLKANWVVCSSATTALHLAICMGFTHSSFLRSLQAQEVLAHRNNRGRQKIK